MTISIAEESSKVATNLLMSFRVLKLPHDYDNFDCTLILGRTKLYQRQ